MQVQGIINNFFLKVQTAINPQITKSYAAGDDKRLKVLLFSGAKFSFFLMLTISLPVIIEIHKLLVWWLDVVPQWTEIFVTLLLIQAILKVLAYSIVQAVQATGIIKKFQIVEGTIQLCILPISYILLSQLKCSPYMPFVIILITEPIVQYARIHIALPLLHISKGDYLREVILPITRVVVLSPILPYTLKSILPEEHPMSFIIVCIIAILSPAFLTFTIGCNEDERFFLSCKIRKILKHLSNCSIR